jgi:hypothetical protein
MEMSKSQLPIPNKLPMPNLQLEIGELEIDWDLALRLLLVPMVSVGEPLVIG